MSVSSCENPQYPTWTWRYNRDKHLSEFQPWYTRVDQWPPRYRHMGVPYGFNFKPLSAREGAPYQQTGLTYARHLNQNRETGFGNAALGNPPGPAPPKLALFNTEGYARPELYRVNEVSGFSGGMSLWDHTVLPPNVSDIDDTPMDPKQYLLETLGQRIEYPGTFPHFSLPPASTGPCPPRRCKVKGDDGPRNPLAIWRERNEANLRGHALERARAGAATARSRFLPPLQTGNPPICAQYALRPASSSIC